MLGLTGLQTLACLVHAVLFTPTYTHSLPNPGTQEPHPYQRGAREMIHIERVNLLLQVYAPSLHTPGGFGRRTVEPSQTKQERQKERDASVGVRWTEPACKKCLGPWC